MGRQPPNVENDFFRSYSVVCLMLVKLNPGRVAGLKSRNLRTVIETCFSSLYHYLNSYFSALSFKYEVACLSNKKLRG